ncbi:MAG: aspartate/prephenate aminotransferase [Ktedonobacteraceae bacterium]
MKTGKQRIHDLPVNDITTLGEYARQVEAEAQQHGIVLPPQILLQIGEPSFRTPEHIRLAAMHAIESEPITYGPAAGWPWLRELIADKIQRVNGYHISPKHVAITMGGTGALLAAFTATVKDGDEVLMPDPAWPLYQMQLAACGAIGVPYALDPHNDWLPNIADLEKLVTPRTRILLINSPGNPTGAIFPKQVVHDLLDFARRHDLYLISDECYDEIVFEGEHSSPATMMSQEEFESGRFIGIYTFSKTYAMTGWRIGYVVTGTNLLKTIVDVLSASYTNMSTPIQRAAAAALTGPQDCAIEMCEAYRRRRDLTVRLLKEYNRYLYTPHGAFYALIDVTGRKGELRGREFALDLLRERNIMVAPGSGFGAVSKHFVRISLGASEEELDRAIREICEFADR